MGFTALKLELTSGLSAVCGRGVAAYNVLASGLILRIGIWLFGNGVRCSVPASVELGSYSICWMPAPLTSPLKSPFLIATVGTVTSSFAACRMEKRSKAKKKNDLFF